MKYDDLEALIDYYNVINKIGLKKIERLLDLLSNEESVTSLVKSLKEARELLLINEVNNSTYKFREENEMDASDLENRLKSYAKKMTLSQLNRFFSIYNFNSLSKRKNELITGFMIYIDKTTKVEFKEVITRLDQYINEISYKPIERNDLNNWNDLIIKNNK